MPTDKDFANLDFSFEQVLQRVKGSTSIGLGDQNEEESDKEDFSISDESAENEEEEKEK